MIHKKTSICSRESRLPITRRRCGGFRGLVSESVQAVIDVGQGCLGVFVDFE
jgi:hypothetical protein